MMVIVECRVGDGRGVAKLIVASKIETGALIVVVIVRSSNHWSNAR